jgi:hypothetical protein
MYTTRRRTPNINVESCIACRASHILISSIIPHIPIPRDAASPNAEPSHRVICERKPASSLSRARIAFPGTLNLEPNHASHAVQHTEPMHISNDKAMQRTRETASLIGSREPTSPFRSECNKERGYNVVGPRCISSDITSLTRQECKPRQSENPT